MKKNSEKIKAVVPLHVNYWKKCNLEKYSGGSFADRSGGMITFEEKDIEKATKIIMDDPFISENLIKRKWIKEWISE